MWLQVGSVSSVPAHSASGSVGVPGRPGICFYGGSLELHLGRRSWESFPAAAESCTSGPVPPTPPSRPPPPLGPAGTVRRAGGLQRRQDAALGSLGSGWSRVT